MLVIIGFWGAGHTDYVYCLELLNPGRQCGALTTDSPRGRMDLLPCSGAEVRAGGAVLKGCRVAGQRDTRGAGGTGKFPSIHVHSGLEIFWILRGTLYKTGCPETGCPVTPMPYNRPGTGPHPRHWASPSA